jgi:hypothetical protein
MIDDLIKNMSPEEIAEWLKSPEAAQAEALQKSVGKLKALLKKAQGGKKLPHSMYMAGLHPATLELLKDTTQK